MCTAANILDNTPGPGFPRRLAQIADFHQSFMTGNPQVLHSRAGRRQATGCQANYFKKIIGGTVFLG
jgi:hypothetical protein